MGSPQEGTVKRSATCLRLCRRQLAARSLVRHLHRGTPSNHIGIASGPESVAGQGIPSGNARGTRATVRKARSSSTLLLSTDERDARPPKNIHLQLSCDHAKRRLSRANAEKHLHALGAAHDIPYAPTHSVPTRLSTVLRGTFRLKCSPWPFALFDTMHTSHLALISL